MSEIQEFYTTAGLMAAAGVKRTAFDNHCKQNVGGILKARMDIPGLGVRWHGPTAKKYLALCQARTARLVTK